MLLRLVLIVVAERNNIEVTSRRSGTVHYDCAAIGKRFPTNWHFNPFHFTIARVWLRRLKHTSKKALSSKLVADCSCRTFHVTPGGAIHVLDRSRDWFSHCSINLIVKKSAVSEMDKMQRIFQVLKLLISAELFMQFDSSTLCFCFCEFQSTKKFNSALNAVFVEMMCAKY